MTTAAGATQSRSGRHRGERPGASGDYHRGSHRQGGSTYAGTALAARLALRRSRWFWLAWIVALWATIQGTAGAYSTFVPNPEQGQILIESLSANATMRAMLGPPFNLYDAGGFAMWRVGTFTAAAAAMMAALGVIRATRAEEEAGRVELLRSGAVSRLAPLTGALFVAFGGCTVLGALIAAGLSAAAPPAAGAVATGVGIALTGAMWAGVGAVTAQVTESARAARGWALGILGGAYLVRAVADGVTPDNPLARLQWASPVEWAALARPYADERWWVLALPAATTVLLVALAYRLEARRDHGGGLRPAALGPARAADSLSTAGALAWRLARGSVIGWTVGLTVFGLVIGSLSGGLDDMLEQSPQVAEIFRRMGGDATTLTDTFYVALLGIMVVVIAMFAVQLTLRLRHEEEGGRTELMLSTSTSRSEYLWSHVSLALAVPTVLLVLTSVGMAATQAVTEGSSDAVKAVVAGAVALVPGVWLVVGLTVAVLGWMPRLTVIPWAVLGWSLVMSWVGALLNLPDWVIKATPFEQLPKVPVETMNWTPWVIEVVLAIVLIAVGIIGFRRRDITP
ncbi:MAG: hypothetical protein Q4G51_12750 [Dermatophilus congolensis]|nr:hypothetical protein [Dermatophilus congolensis]